MGSWRARLVSVLAVGLGCSAPPPPAPSPTPSPPPAPAPAVTAPAPTPEPEPEPAAPVDKPASLIAITKGTRVLLFGDSMVTSGLGVTLKEHVVARGGTLVSISKPSSTTASWRKGHELDDLIAKVKPDVVIVVLASNELFIPNPQARIGDVKTIVSRIGTRPCVWIGPPPWRPDKGMLGVVRDNAAPCRWFESAELTLERQSDGIHPTLRGGRVWGEAVWRAAFAE